MNERTDDDVAAEGKALAVLMVESIESRRPTNEGLVNAIGSITEATFMGLGLCDKHMLEEFNSWVEYTRDRLAEAIEERTQATRQ